ncbi:MAG: helix-turn-helix transcriptional regulator [Deltaproteobacteria bacterium]|nr:helix-turn-helix transcriptional regulator [Deltaproteobacteria bacterium]
MGTAERRKRERGERQRRILDAARAVFSARGLEAATMDDVAARAELSKGALYLYFTNKDDLLAAILIAPLDELVARFEDEDGAPSTGAARVQRLLGLHVDFIRKNLDLLRLAFRTQCQKALAEPPSSPLVVRERRRRLIDAYARAIEEGRRDGSIRRSLDAQAVATHLWAAVFGVALLAIDDPDTKQRLDSVIGSILDVAARGLAADSQQTQAAARRRSSR